MVKLPTSIVCFSHLRWDSSDHRPQKVLTYFSKNFNVYYVEEPVFTSRSGGYISFTKKDERLWVGVPHLPAGISKSETAELLDDLLDKFLHNEDLSKFIFWYYTPAALAYTEYFHPRLTVYDCMASLTSFKLPPYELKLLESKLFDLADLVFTADEALHQLKKHQHENIHMVSGLESWNTLTDKMLDLIKSTLNGKDTLAA